MLTFLIQNFGTLTVLCIVLLLVAAAAYVVIRDKKQGKCACGGSCGACGGDCGGCAANRN